MSKYYGQVIGAAETVGSRRGYKGIRSSAQTWDGSLIVIAKDNKEGKTVWQIEYSDVSEAYGKKLFEGSLEDLVDLFESNHCYQTRMDDDE